MKVLSKTSEHNSGTVATIGFFDGVHCGHQYVLSMLRELAEERGLESMVVSFSNHPMLYFNPQSEIRLLSTVEEKLEKIASMGIDNTLLLDFDSNLSRLTAKEFLTLLGKRYGVELLLIGYDHRFGSDKQNSFNDYVEYGKELGIEIVKLVSFTTDNITVSSSQIREQLTQSHVEQAAQMLGYNYTLRGTVIAGNQIGRTLGFPTANIKVDSFKLLPANGVYAVQVIVKGELYKGILNIGQRPTLPNSSHSMEVHILDFEGDVYGDEITISFIKKLRDERKFDSLDQLRQQIMKDKNTVLEG